MTVSLTDKQIKIQFRAARILCRREVSPSGTPAPAPYPLPSNSSTLTLPYNSKNVASPLGDEFVIFSKSYAQVATSVRPQVVRLKSGELKLGRHRPHRLMGRFSNDEKETVEAKAKAARLSVNEYIRAVSLGADYKAPHDPEWTKALLAANRELTRQGTNLNQIAHKRNSNLIDEAQTDSLLGILTRSLLQAHKAVRAALTYGRRPEP